MAEANQVAKRVVAAVVVLGLVAAVAAFLLPRLSATGSPGSSTPVPGPSGITRIRHPLPFFPTLAKEADGYPESIVGGTLVEEKGCVLVRDVELGIGMMLWPHGWSVEWSADGVLSDLDDSGTPAFRVGEEIRVGGGELGDYPLPPERLPEELIGRPIPERCKVGRYLITSGNSAPSL
jgi:hypothetical protein